ncbi:MAG: hypothetical protein IPG74_19520 [Flavobacteriales bacterium]|nr:hypothetical protein [Flavobacteriales bacterium]
MAGSVKAKQDSIMTSYYASGQVMESGWYKKGVKDSTWLYFFADGKPLLNEVWNDSLVIVIDAWDKDGSRTLTKGDGLVRAYFPSGAKQEETAYAVGVKSGSSTLFYPSGLPQAKGTYLAGVRHGKWEYWFSNGTLQKVETYQRGKLSGPYLLNFSSGEPNIVGHYKDGLKDSLWTWHTTKAQKDMEGSF